MARVAALCFDIDGTLIDDQKVISRRTIYQIRRYVDLFGCRIVLTSSRMPRSLRVVSDEIGIECDIVAYDGGHCIKYENGASDLRFDCTVSDFDNSILDKIDLGEDLFCGLFHGEDWIVSGSGYWLDRELRSTKTLPDAVDERLLRDLFKSGKPFSKLMFRGEPSKVKFARSISSSMEKVCNFYSNKGNIIEFVPAKVSKAYGAAKVLGLPDGSLSGVVAFGDGYNDVSLMKAAEFSVSMGNAVEPCRAAAKYATLDNNSDGIAKFLSEFRL